MGITNIEWTDFSFNAWIGCTKVSAGCKNCYAEADMDKRRGRVVWGVNGTRSVTSYSYWREPLKWNREAEKTGIRKRVFCASLADVFEDWNGQVVDAKGVPLWWSDYESYQNVDVDGIPLFPNTKEETTRSDVPLTLNHIRQKLFWLIDRTPHLDWLLLTKRPENIMDMVPDLWQCPGFGFLANVWIGTSVEDQEAADKRIPELLKVPAVVRFLSCEPLLGPVSFNNIPMFTMQGLANYIKYGPRANCGIHWCIIGGESGHNARPMNPAWATGLINECDIFHIPVLFKQWGEWHPYTAESENLFGPDYSLHNHFVFEETNTHLYKVGKKQSGRIINGRTYDGLPVISQK